MPPLVGLLRRRPTRRSPATTALALLSLWQPLRVRCASRRERAGSASLLDSLHRAVLDGDAVGADSDADVDADDNAADALHCRPRLPLATPRGAVQCRRALSGYQSPSAPASRHCDADAAPVCATTSLLAAAARRGLHEVALAGRREGRRAQLHEAEPHVAWRLQGDRDARRGRAHDAGVAAQRRSRRASQSLRWH